MRYLLRLAEAGREAQEPRSRVRPDVLAVIREKLPDAQTSESVGRVIVDSATDARDVLSDIHGVLSFSPCRLVALVALADAVDQLAAATLPGMGSFRITVKRTGDHDFNSHEKAAALGARVIRRFPDLRVELKEPDAFIGVEIRDDDCYIYNEVVTGLDWRDQPLARPGEWPRFLVDQMLGHLLPWLRLLGFDTITVLDEADSLLQRVARAENRILLTKDYELSRSQAVNVYFVDATEALDQIQQVLHAYAIQLNTARMFSRCTQCNDPVALIDKAPFADRIPAEAYDKYDEFSHCSRCDKVYWKGTQYARIMERLGRL